jgi:translation initiation factor 6 (eIF-6)
VGLVEDDGTVARQVVVVHGLAQQHSVRHVLQDGVLARLVLETNAVSDLLAELDVHLLGHTLRNGHGSDTTGLRAGNHLGVLVGEVVEEHELRNLRRLSGTRLTDEDEDLRLLVELEELISARG